MSNTPPVRYRSADDDSQRWQGFEFRPGDIVISTRSKHGTTWMQMICALLIFETTELPQPLAELSPWLDWLITPRADVIAQLDSQQHRRIVKTHTPLDGLPLSPHATYIVVARHPLDAAVSLYHQGNNLNRARLAELIGNPQIADPAPRPPLAGWLHDWVNAETAPADQLESLNGVFHHLSDAWRRRDHNNVHNNVHMLHYQDLLDDLPGEMRRLAGLLGISPDTVTQDLIAAATLSSMRANSNMLAPDPAGVLNDKATFFRQGISGTGSAALDPTDLATYHARAAALAPADLLAWLHR